MLHSQAFIKTHISFPGELHRFAGLEKILVFFVNLIPILGFPRLFVLFAEVAFEMEFQEADGHISGWVCVYGRACVRECVFVYELTKANICTFLRPNMHAYAHELSVCLPACVRVCVGVRV